ncbi:MAG: hypothetical protein WC683_04325 [bacterium]
MSADEGKCGGCAKEKCPRWLVVFCGKTAAVEMIWRLGGVQFNPNMRKKEGEK